MMAKHKSFFNQFVTLLNSGDENLAQQLVNPKAKFYQPYLPGTFIGPKGCLEIAAIIHNGFPDVKWSIDEILPEKETTLIKYTVSGTHDGLFLGIQPTSKFIEFKAMSNYKIENNQIIEEIGKTDWVDELRDKATL